MLLTFNDIEQIRGKLEDKSFWISPFKAEWVRKLCDDWEEHEALLSDALSSEETEDV